MKKYLYVIIVVIVALIYFLVPRATPTKEVVNPDDENSSQVCTEGSQRMVGANSFTCINGEWIYTGQDDNNKG